LYFPTAAAVVQSRLYEPCSVYYFASFYDFMCDKKFRVVLCVDRGVASERTVHFQRVDCGMGWMTY